MKKILIILLGIILLSGCASKEESSEVGMDFPISRDNVTTIIKESNLPWSVGDEYVSVYGEDGYLLKNGNGKNTAVINYYDNKRERKVRVSLLSEHSDKELEPQRLEDEAVLKAFYLAGEAFGFDSLANTQRVYKEITRYMKDRSSASFGSTVFENKYGNNYFTIALDVKDENYEISYIQVENKESYEKGLRESGEELVSNVADTMIIVEDASIKELRDIDEEGILVLKGHIKKQSKLSAEKAKLLTSIDKNGKKHPISRYDYVDAIIESDKDEIAVILKINGLSEKEIKEERTHYIYYSKENTVGIIEYSPY